jgi:uncharacterized protein YhjY with autotransporter beta-barrel domain
MHGRFYGVVIRPILSNLLASLFVFLIVAAILPIRQAQAQCANSGTNQTCTNPAGTTVSGGPFGSGIIDFGVLTITNFGAVAGSSYGVVANIGNVNNYGTIVGGLNGILANTANVNNFGTISGVVQGIEAANVNINNSGSISGGTGITLDGGSGSVLTNSGQIVGTGGTAIDFHKSINDFLTFLPGSRVQGSILLGNGDSVSNYGAIVGGGILANTGGSGSMLTNSGQIVGTGGTAIDFHNSTNDFLTFLPGSRVQGAILLGTGDSVSVVTGRDIAQLLTVTPNGIGSFSINGSGSALFAINGTKFATLDPTAFGMTDRTLMDFTGAVSGLVNSRFDNFMPESVWGSSNAFAATASNAVPLGVNSTSAGIPSAATAYAADPGPSGIPNMVATDPTSGVAVWSNGFVGGRKQDANGLMLSSTNYVYGGAFGFDRLVASDFRLGAFVGAGNGKLEVDLGSQTVNTNYIFGGVYGRYNWLTQYLDFVVSTGHSSNNSTRLVADNTVGFSSPTGSYNGWFVSPDLTYGYRIPLASNMLLKPVVRLRYLYASFDGYSETGSAQNLVASGRSVQDLEERFGFDLSRIDEVKPQSFVKTSVQLGVVGLERLGNNTINTVLIGQNLSFATPGEGSVGGLYSGIGIDYRITKTVSVFAAGEGTFMADHSTVGTAKGGMKVVF